MSGKVVSLKMDPAMVEKVNKACRALENDPNYTLLLRNGKITFSQGVRILLQEALKMRTGDIANQTSLKF